MSKTSIIRTAKNVSNEITKTAAGTIGTVVTIAAISGLMWGMTSLGKVIASPFKEPKAVERPALSAKPKTLTYKF